MVLMSHMGRPTGHKFSALRTCEEKKERCLQIWSDEAGAGYTTFFSLCSGEEKKKILSWSSVAVLANAVSETEGAGKTDLFAALSNDEKKSLLYRFQTSDERYCNVFPHLRKYNGFDDELTLRPVAAQLSKLLNESRLSPWVDVKFAEDCLNADEEVASLEPGQVMLLENVRFYSDENSRKESERRFMAQKIASYGDYFVSDAFGTCHRINSATMVDLPAVLGHGGTGYLLQSKILAYAKLLGGAARPPVVAFVGGTKVSDKVLLLEHIMTQVDSLVNHRWGDCIHFSEGSRL